MENDIKKLECGIKGRGDQWCGRGLVSIKLRFQKCLVLIAMLPNEPNVDELLIIVQQVVKSCLF